MPSDQQGAANTFMIEALLIGGDSRVLRVVLTPYLLHLEREAIVSVENMASPPGLDLARARPLRLVLRSASAVLAIYDGRAVEEGLWTSRCSFAKRTRSQAAVGTAQSDEIRERTRAFLLARGIAMTEGP
jgi:hypothetical protein